MRILIAEDERRLAGAIARGLRREGMAVDITHDGASALMKARVFPYDVVVLDRDLPELHGDEVCRRLSGDERETKVLMLTAADSLDDVVDGLTLGADDYLPKPFEWKELVARIRALARRAGRARPAVLRRGDLELDPARRSVTRAGDELDLTPKEFGVLEALMSADGAAVSAEDLLQQVWDEHADPFTNTVRMTVMTAAAQARRAGGARDGHGRRLPGLMPRPTVRLRLTLLYAGVFLLASAALLTVSYILVRNNVTADHVSVGSGPADELRRAIQREVADDALQRLRVQYAIALAAMTALSVLLGWLVAGRVLRPLQQITATARRVSQDTLDERIALEGPRDELKELADTFDAMLERLSGAFASHRRFVANASHELRTPLTVMRTELEVTLADPDATNAELRTMAEAVHDALDRTERLVQSLLTLARSEGAVTRRDPLDLASAARLALEHAGRDAQAAGLAVTADLHPAPVSGDRRLLESLVANLVENAVGHNRPGGRVSVTTSSARRAQRRRGRQRRRGARSRRAAESARAVRAHRPRRPRRRRRPRPLDRALGGAGPRRRRRARRVPGRRPARDRDPSARRTGGADPTRPLLSGACPCLSADPSCAVRPTWPP